MNIHDVEVNLPSGDKLENIFQRQRELMAKYRVIEERNGFPFLTGDYPVNLHDAMSQHRIKDLFWRFTEELCEALDAYAEDGCRSDHVKEEIADAMHFLVEACIVIGIEPQVLSGVDTQKLEHLFTHSPYVSGIDRTYLSASWAFTDMMRTLGMAANCLKNKPWKTTHMLTDVDLFRARVSFAFRKFITFCKYMGLTADELYLLYFKKSEVNKFRQRSNY